MDKTIYCTFCEESIKSKAFPGHLRSIKHKNNSAVDFDTGIEKINSAFRGRIASYRIRAERERQVDGVDVAATDPAHYLRCVAAKLQTLIDSTLSKHINVKANFELFAKVILPKDGSMEIKSFATKNICVHQSYSFDDLLDKISEIICKKIDEFQEKGSGWSILDILYLEININKYTPLKGSCYLKLPNKINAKHACVNIKNNDEYCFAWTIMAALHPAKKNGCRVSSYPHFSTALNLKNMSFL